MVGQEIGAPAAVDRSTAGEPAKVAWLADGDRDEWLRLDLPVRVEGRAAVLHGMGLRTKEGGPLTVKRSELVLYSGGAEVRRVAIDRAISPGGTRVDLGGARFDAMVFRPLAVEGKFRGRPLAALAEIEILARITGE